MEEERIYIIQPSNFEKAAAFIGKIAIARWAYIITKATIATYKEYKKDLDIEMPDTDIGNDFDCPSKEPDIPSNENIASAN